METKKYIAYGSNLNLIQMAHRCPNARSVGIASLKDHRLIFAGQSKGAVASIEPAAGYSVPVLVWDITQRDERSLDRYEGYPYFYEKQELTVEVNGEPITAMAYVMTPGHVYGTPGESYLNGIKEGYATAGFDMAVLEEAVAYSTEHLREVYGLPADAMDQEM